MAKKKLPPPLPSNTLARLIVSQAVDSRPDQLFRWMVERVLITFDVDIDTSCPDNELDRVGLITASYIADVRNSEPYSDILSPALHALATYWPEEQPIAYFTPQPIAEMMSESKFSSMAGQSVAAICDPSCGTGTLLLALLRVLVRSKSQEALLEWSVTASDKDSLSLQVCSAQFLTNAAVHHTSPGSFTAILTPACKMKQLDKVFLQLRYIEASRQLELVKSGSTWAGSAQKALI